MPGTDLSGMKVYPYRVLFPLDDGSGKWACVDLRKGQTHDVRDGHLRCLMRHQAQRQSQRPPDPNSDGT